MVKCVGRKCVGRKGRSERDQWRAVSVSVNMC